MQTVTELVREARHGSSEAWNVLIEASTGYLNAYFSCHYLGHLTEELTQETFARAFQRINELKDPTRFRNWLTGIARNLRHDYWRKNGRYEPGDPDENALADPTPSVDEILIETERQRQLMTAVESLPTRQRQVVILRHVNGWSLDQIAEELDISKNAVSGSLYQALKKLKKVVGE